MSKLSKRPTLVLVSLFILGVITLIGISYCNETFLSDTPGKDKSIYYGSPKIESHGDTTYVTHKDSVK